jgi:uncharacterized protein (TIGR02117 family)
MMRQFFRIVGGALVLAATLLILGTFVPRPLFAVASGDDTAKLHRILMLSNPIHTDIAVPIDGRTRELLGFLREAGIPLDAPNARYLIFGRGGREFYLSTPTWSELKPGPLVKGLTLDRAAMHVDIAGDIVVPHANVTAIEIGDVQYEALLRFILDSFARSGGQPVLIPGVQYGEHDRFYEANGYFTAVLGCNTWTAEGLREAGLRTGWWNPVPATLRMSLDLYN